MMQGIIEMKPEVPSLRWALGEHLRNEGICSQKPLSNIKKGADVTKP